MRTPGPQSIELLSLAGRRVGGELALDAADRPAVPRDPILRVKWTPKGGPLRPPVFVKAFALSAPLGYSPGRPRPGSGSPGIDEGAAHRRTGSRTSDLTPVLSLFHNL